MQDNELKEAYNDLLNEEKELKKGKKLLENYDKLTLGEETYHALCHTPMRYTDKLGRDLAGVIGFEYDERGANGFWYKLPNGWGLCVPSYDITGVDICVPDFYEGLYENLYTARFQREEIERTQAKIREIEEEFFNAGLVGRANSSIRLGRHIRLRPVRNAVRVATYVLSNRGERYYKHFTTVFDCLKNSEAKQLKIYADKEREWNEAYYKQEKDLKKYAEVLFKWTDKIRVSRQNDKGGLLPPVKRTIVKGE